jgi:hypothetical protein
MATVEKKFLDKDGLEYYNGHFYTKTKSDALRNYDDYYEEITWTKERFYDTDCYFVTIPMTDNEGKEIKLYIGDAGADGTPITYARENHTTFTCNATLNLGGSIGVGSVIANGEIVRDVDTSSSPYDANLYLGIKENRVIAEYQFNQTTAQQMLADGCIQAWDVYYKILDNGIVLDMSQVVVGDSGVPTAKHPRQCLGQKADGTIIMLSCDGCTSINAGLTSEETAQILLDKGCLNAWNLDGGGSTSTEIEESKLNRNIDGDGTKDRKIRWTLNVKKPTVNETMAKAFSKISIEKQNIIQQIIPYIDGEIANVIPRDSEIINGKNLDTLVDRIYIGYGDNLTNYPASESQGTGYFVNIPHSWDEWKGKYATQFFIRRDINRVYTRQMENSVFTPWMRVKGNDRALITGIDSAQSIATTSVYQPAAFKYLYNNNSELFSKADYDSGTDSFTKFSAVSSGSCVLRGQVDYTAATAGQKFISFYRGDTRIGHSIVRLSADVGQAILLETVAIITDLASSDEISLRVWGTQGDSFHRVKVEMELD